MFSMTWERLGEGRKHLLALGHRQGGAINPSWAFPPGPLLQVFLSTQFLGMQECLCVCLSVSLALSDTHPGLGHP